MRLRLYVMDIRELEEAALCAAALRLLDSERKEKALKAGNAKDRARRVGAGLLLLLGHERMDERASNGNDSLQILSPAIIIQTIEDEEKKRGCPLSEGIQYEISDRGRPAWKQAPDYYPYFNLSHSGNYAALVTGDVEVGIDVQEPRKVLHRSIGNYQSFCKLESYFKCTGRGIDKRIDDCYAELEEAESSGEYLFRSINMPDEYALWVCARNGKPERS
ncbi:MAG: hypothetical protein LUE16_06945 [Lachnospiraceae bacterium]|nr:hypothetical protein [Lachnospiraceae bacterium]